MNGVSAGTSVDESRDKQISSASDDGLPGPQKGMYKAMDHGCDLLAEDYGVPIDMMTSRLAHYLACRYYGMKGLVRDDITNTFSIDEGSSPKFAQFYPSLCPQGRVPVTDVDRFNKIAANTLLLLNDSCKLVSNNLRDDVLLERLDENMVKALRACIELEEMDKEISSYPALMRAFATQELDEAECWFQILSKAWERIPVEAIIDLLKKVSGQLISASSTSYSNDVVKTLLGELEDLGKHPVFRWLISVTRDHVAQVTTTLMGEPASWLRIFLKPPNCKSQELMRTFSGHKQALAAVAYTYRRCCRLMRRKPYISFLVVDTSGLYVEEFARSLSKMIFDSSDALIRIDMSQSAGSASVGNNLEKLFDGVRRRPYAVIIFNNIERANGAAICTLKQILSTGYASDESGKAINFTYCIIFVLLHGLSPFCTSVCNCMDILKSRPFKSHLGATSSSSQDRCQCVAVLKEARDHVDAKIWELVDDVAMFGSLFPGASFHLMAYARCLLREMAQDLCSGGLILYPSEAALKAILYRKAENINGEKAVKSWLENHVKPVLEDLVKKGSINEKSVVFIDKYAGTSELCYAIENKEDHFRGVLAKKFRRLAADVKCTYERGKNLEQCLAYLTEKLRSAIEAANFDEAKEELITLSTTALSAADDLKLGKEKLCLSVGGSDDAELKSEKEALSFQTREGDVGDRSSKRFKIRQDNLWSEGGGSEVRLAAHTIVDHVLQGMGNCSSVASLLILGLRDEGKKELVNELAEKSAIIDDRVKIFAIDMSEYSDEGSLLRFKSCPLRTFSNDNESLSLLEAVRKHPHCIFYFDKIEDAHIDVYGLLMLVLRYGVLSDDEEQGKDDIDVRGCFFVFGSDCGNMKTIAELAGGGGGGDREAAAAFGKWWEEKQRSQRCLRHELVCKVDRVAAFNPFVIHQLESSSEVRVCQGEEIRRCAAGIDFKEWFLIFRRIFEEDDGVNEELETEEKANMIGKLTVVEFQEMMVGWLPSLPDPFAKACKSDPYRLPLF